MEIYNEDVRDLLGKDQHAKLEVKNWGWHANKIIFLKEWMKEWMNKLILSE